MMTNYFSPTALASGGENVEDIIACTNKDVTTVIVPLYTGDCMLNTYFMALAGVESYDNALYIMSGIAPELKAKATRYFLIM